MSFSPHALAAALAACLLLPLRSSAQSAGAPDPEKVRVRFGPLWLNPTLSLSNAGVDTNVFNEADTDRPKRDFTMTVTPQTNLWLRFGRTWVSGTIQEDLLYYATYKSEQTANTSYRLGWQVPFNRVVLEVTGAYLNARDRPGFEIDARSQRSETNVDGSVEIRALPKTFVKIAGGRQRVNFDKDAGFLDANLHYELNRTSTHGGIALRHQTTPLTSLGLSVSRTQDRFELSPLRDANSTAVVATVSLDTFALIKGAASIGYRDFEPLSPGLSNFRGAVADMSLSYVVLSATRIDLRGSRDVQYSYDITSPYYVQTGATLSVTQQVFGPIDVVGRVGLQHLDYRTRAGALLPEAVTNRGDAVRLFGGGVGYRLRKDVRLGLNVDQQNRSSALADRRYHDLRVGTSVTYGGR